LPVTYAVMTIGTLAITGFGIPSLGLGLAGFYSKDMIIESAWAAAMSHGGVAAFAFVVSLLAAGLTAFYSWRLAFMTFHGTPKWAEAGAQDHDDHAHDGHAAAAHGHDDHAHDDHGHGHGAHTPHESPVSMLAPILLLSVGAIAAGYAFKKKFVGDYQEAFWGDAIFNAPANTVLEQAHHAPAWVIWAPLVVSAIGFGVAWYVYIAREGLGARIAAKRGLVWSFLYNKWYFDELYQATFVRAAKRLGDLFWKVGDQKIIDGLGPDGVSAVSYALGRRTGRLQTGFLYHYAFVMLLGVAGLLTFALWAWRA
ncbi:MAG: NADH-quinone oxidoreductase subunit L, partial [Phenylobacterium sp.]|nr:NADH-quinone oxidoreductase subunit L [Phenylobacterium sp.]